MEVPSHTEPNDSIGLLVNGGSAQWCELTSGTWTRLEGERTCRELQEALVASV